MLLGRMDILCGRNDTYRSGRAATVEAFPLQPKGDPMNARVSLVSATDTPDGSRALLDAVHGAFGATPNMFRAVANSPAALQAMWGFFGALGGGSLPAKLAQ
jgi:hypothetical protein